MSNFKILFISITILIQSTCWAQDQGDEDSTRLFFDNFPAVEIPVTVIPLSRLEFLFPDNKESNLPFAPLFGGNFLIYPKENWKVGIFIGFIGGNYQIESFDGTYEYDGEEKPLEVDMRSSIFDYRVGLKFIDYMKRSRFRPYSEVFVSRMLFHSYLTIDHRRANERRPPIEYQQLNRRVTGAYHANLGLEIDLMKNITIETRKYKDLVAFFFVSIGYSYGRNPVRHLDVSQAVMDRSTAQNAEINHRHVNSSSTNFSAYVPEWESLIRYFNLSFGFTCRL